MTRKQSEAGKRRAKGEAEEKCPNCLGSGRVKSLNPSARARRGGNAAYLNSFRPGAMSMSERGRRGGNPPLPTIDDLEVPEKSK